jgi:hypothetical protein
MNLELLQIARDVRKHMLVAALWSTSATDPKGSRDWRLEEYFNTDQLHPSDRVTVRAFVCGALREAFRVAPDWCEHWTPEQFGHDLWLTMARHGAGFWDRGGCIRKREIGHYLTEMAHVYHYDLSCDQDSVSGEPSGDFFNFE